MKTPWFTKFKFKLLGVLLILSLILSTLPVQEAKAATKTYYLYWNTGTTLTQPSVTTNTTCPGASDTSMGTTAGIALMAAADDTSCVPVTTRDIIWSNANTATFYANAAVGGYGTAMEVTGTSVKIAVRAVSGTPVLTVKLFYVQSNNTKVYFTGSATQTVTTTRNNYTINLTGLSASSIPAGSKIGVEFSWTATDGMRLQVNSTNGSNDQLIVNETSAATCTSTSSSNWNNSLTWTCLRVPLSIDTVRILGTMTVAVDIPNAVANNITINSDNAGANCGINLGANTLTVTNGITFNANNVAGTCQISASTGTLSAASLTINGGSFGANQVIASGAATINISGPVAINAPTADGLTNQISVGSGSFTAGSLAIAGGTNTRIGMVTLSTGTVTVNSDVSFSGTAANARLVYTGTGTVNIKGNLGSGGTLSTVAGSVTNFNGTSVQTAGGAYTYNILKANNAAGVILGGASTVTTLTIGDVTGSSVFADGGYVITPGASSVLNLTSGTYKLGSASVGTAWPTWGTLNIAAGTTVEYASGQAQTIAAHNYANLTSSSTGARTLPSSGTIGISGAFTHGSNTYTLTGSTIDFNGSGSQTIPAFNYYNLTSSNSGSRTLPASGTVGVAGTFTPGSNSTSISGSTIEFNGTGGGQTIPLFTYNNLTLNNSDGASLGGNATINGSLTFTNGKITTNANTLIVASGGSVTGAGSGKYIYGNLQKTVATGSPSLTFEVGDASVYAPISITFSSVSTGGTLTGSTTAGRHPQFLSAGIGDKYVNRYWTLTPSGLAFTNYNTISTFVSGDLIGSPDTNNLIVQKYSSGWSSPTSRSSTATTVTGNGFTAFGDFFAGEGGTPTPVTLSYFLAKKQGSNVNFSWSTETETGNVGFNLYVENKGLPTLINSQLIPSKVIDSLDRQDYFFSTKLNGTVFYIEDVSVLGETYRHGPFQIGRKFGAQLSANPVDWAVVQTEHNDKAAGRQSQLAQGLTNSASAVAAANPTPSHRLIRAASPTKTPVPSKTPAPSKTPTTTRTSSFTATRTATGAPSATATPTFTDTPVPSDTSVPTDPPIGTLEPTPTPTDPLEPTATLEPSTTETATLEPSATFEPTVTETETATMTPTATSTSTETATSTTTYTPTATPVVPATALPVDPTSLQLSTTFNFKVRQTGIQRVSYETLRDAGLDLAGVPVAKITVINRNMMVPVYGFTPDAEGSFGTGGYIEFYGEALDTIYTDTNIYTVQVSTAMVPHIPGVDGALRPGVGPEVSYTYSQLVNNQRVYSQGAPGVDVWFDTAMQVTTASKSWSYTFQVNGLVGDPATFDLDVWGMTNYPQDPDHHILVSINGLSLANEKFDGQVEKKLSISLPAGLLQEGTNTLQLTLPADLGLQADIIYLDKYTVTFQRVFQAQNGRLMFTSAGNRFDITNLPNGNVEVYRLSLAGQARLENVNIQISGNTYTASFAGTNQNDTYLVTTTDAMYTPTLEAVRTVAKLDQPAQYLIIAHPDFISGLQPLVDAHRAQGLAVSVVDVNDLYAKLTYGIFDPDAIKQYIAYAAKYLGTEYVLLVGGDTYDYRNYTGRNSNSFIPSLFLSTGARARNVPVDPLYADVNNDNVPDLAIGRFPVRNSAELNLMVSKTLAYAGKDYGGTAVFASDLNDGIVSYKEVNNGMAASLPVGWSVQNIHLDDVSVATARTQLLTAMNGGTALVTFTGHSGPASWTFSNLFNISDAAALTNTGRPFVVVQWGCWNTYYIDPVNNFLVQKFLFSGNQGAVVVMGGTTLVDSTSERLLGNLLTPRLATPGTTVGQALQVAKSELAQSHPELLDVLLGWSLMGDPALVIQP
jgi:hypothetical protein